MLGCAAPVKRPGSGFLTLSEGGEDRITLGVEGSQAEVALLSPTGDDLVLDAGPEGAALAVKAPGPWSWAQWLDQTDWRTTNDRRPSAGRRHEPVETVGGGVLSRL